MKIELDIEEIVGDMFTSMEYLGDGEYTPSLTFKEAVKEEVLGSITRTILREVNLECLASARQTASAAATTFIEQELQLLVREKLHTGEILSTNETIKSIDALIEAQFARINLDLVINKHIHKIVEDFTKDLKVQYNNVFASKVVQSLAANNMLNPDVAKLLLGESK